MHVGGGGIPTGVAVLQGLRADGAALLLGKVCVPGLGQRAGAGEARAGSHAGEAADLSGAVGVLALGLADALVVYADKVPHPLYLQGLWHFFN